MGDRFHQVAVHRRGHVVVAHPSADRYGADKQLLESITALVDDGWRVTVVTPADGPLMDLLTERGAEIGFLDFPVVRRASLSPGGLLALGWSGARAALRARAFLRTSHAEIVYVNTITVPWWLAAARLAGVRCLCHVHESEQQEGRVIRLLLHLPLLLAHRVICISEAVQGGVEEVLPGLTRRCELVRNGVPDPKGPRTPPSTDGPLRAVVVSRLSPRKGIHVALDAVGIIRERGWDMRLDVWGTAFEGYEAYEEALRLRAEKPDLHGAVTFGGYTGDVWSALAGAHVALAASTREPFGNAVVEAQLSGVPVIAAASMGHLESIESGESGVLVPPGDAVAMADAIEYLARRPCLSARLGEQGRRSAQERFGLATYRRRVVEIVRQVGGL